MAEDSEEHALAGEEMDQDPQGRRRWLDMLAVRHL